MRMRIIIFYISVLSLSFCYSQNTKSNFYAFKTGEKLEYKLNYGFLNASYASLTLKEELLDGKKVLEAINKIENITNKKLSTKYINKHRKGDHIWWISDISKFKTHYPEWNFTYDLEKIISEIFSEMTER